MAVTERAAGLGARASKVMASGVIAGGRKNVALGRVVYFVAGEGPRLRDVDGNDYLDFSSSSGASLLGYNVPEVNEAVAKAIALGLPACYESPAHVELCERLCAILPGAERVRLTPTGSEATMAAIRLARGATGRERILKFDGCFHGMHESIFWNSQTPPRQPRPFVPPHPDSDGLPRAFGDLVVTVPYNDPEAFTAAMDRYGEELAAVILEPVSYNQGCIPADPRWLALVREQTRRRGIVLVFDEVLSGFRMALGGAAEHYGITPDLATWAKALGAGWPIAAVTGTAAVMEHYNPAGHVVVSGTYTGHPAAVYASLAALKVMSRTGFYQELNRKADTLYAGIARLFAETGLVGRVQGLGARFGIYFGISTPVRNHQDASAYDRALSGSFVRLALERGLYFHDFGPRTVPMHWGITAAFTDADIQLTLQGLEGVFARLAGEQRASAA
jgi:glutamate-1-semialdehyde 2,1-aminomutase